MSDRELVQLWHLREHLRVSEDDIQQEARAEFAERASEVRDTVTFLLKNGLNEGAQTALGTLAEEDMGDFCILVDLAEGVNIEEVEPLDDETCLHLQEFLASDPWHNLKVDIDITVSVAMVEDVATSDAAHWFDISPKLPGVVARVLAEANGEQLSRFTGELSNLHQRTGISIPVDVLEILVFIIGQAAARLGIRPPVIDNQ